MIFRYVVFLLIQFWQFFCPGLSSFGFSAYILDLFPFFSPWPFFPIIMHLRSSYIGLAGHPVVSVVVVN